MNTKIKNTILIVDDELISRILLRKVFEEKYNVIEACNGKEALDMMRAYGDISVVILDIFMHEMNGYQVLGEMRKDAELKRIPVVVLTSLDDEDDQIRALELGAADFIEKPFNSRMIQLRIRNIIERKKSEMIAKENEMMRMRLAQNEELLRIAQTDEKTGLDNKHTFFRKAANLIKNNPNTKYAIVVWDIDNFKVYNDLFGSVEGDRLLKRIGDTYSVHKELLSSRLYAEQFAICVPAENMQIERRLDHWERFLAYENKHFEFIPRIGVYVVDDSTDDVRLMCDRAVMALKSVKNSYSEKIAYYNDTMRQSLLDEQEIIAQMLPALKSGQFKLFFQPQYNHVNGCMIGVEVLVRWMHPEKGILSPAVFIPIFEKNGFIARLDEYIFEETCKFVRKCLDSGMNIVPASVNFSRIDLYNPQFCAKLCELIEKYNIEPWMVCIEITETAYIDNPNQLIAVVDQIKSNSFNVYMDDFGSGYSSLNMLKELSVDMIKLDMTFITDNMLQKRSRIILKSIIKMMKHLNVRVIAEGVETMEQADYLRQMGCRLVQGYLYARPMPEEEFIAKLKSAKLDENKDSYDVLGSVLKKPVIKKDSDI